MRVVLVILLAVVAVNARWQIYASRAENEDQNVDLDWWENGVFYQIYPRSFKDSDKDGIGDLQGITDNLDHLKDLGVTGTWLSPIFLSPMKDGGYDIQDFKTVHPMFGSNDDLKKLFAKAKGLGIKIILDFVPNHTSDQHEWFQKSRSRTPGFENYYVWEDCPLINPEGPVDGPRRYKNNWIAVFHTPAWTYDTVRGQCYLHQFTPEQPDLNYRNKEVYQNMIDILEYWLKEGADGFRIDAINHMFETEGLPFEEYIDPNGDRSRYDNLKNTNTMNRPESYEFIYDVRAMMDKYVFETDNITRLMMTEAYASIEEQVKWYGNSSETRGSHMPFNFVLIADLDENSTAKDFNDAIYSWIDKMPDYGNANWVLGNHDRPRLGTRYGEERHESLAIMSMMLPGLNVIYYGEEIRMVNNFNISFADSDDPQARQTNESVYMLYTRDPVRTPFQWDDSEWAGFSETTTKTWLPVHENYKTVNLKAQKEADKSTYKLYKELISLRKESQVLKIGGYMGKAMSENVFGFLRTLAGHHTIAVIVNLGKATTANITELLENEFSDSTKAKILIVNNDSKFKVGDSIGDVQKIELGDYDALVLEVSSASTLAVSMALIFVSLMKFFF